MVLNLQERKNKQHFTKVNPNQIKRVKFDFEIN